MAAMTSCLFAVTAPNMDFDIRSYMVVNYLRSSLEEVRGPFIPKKGYHYE